MNRKRIKIAIAGTGNVGTHLIRRFTELPEAVTLTGVWSRRPDEVKKILGNCIPVTDDPAALLPADVVVLALPDRIIGEFSKKFAGKDVLTVHTSGVMPKEILHTRRKGIFYPLQSFRKEKPDMNWDEIPVFIDANLPGDMELLEYLAGITGGRVERITPEKQTALHTAAVFANNFTNALFTIADDILRKENLDFKLLLPLIKETVSRLETRCPEEMQTGPAVRGDRETVQKHLEWLRRQGMEDEKAIYELLTEYIEKRFLE